MLILKQQIIKKKLVSLILERESGEDLLVCSPSSYNSQDWARRKGGATDFIQVSHVGDWCPGT